MFRLIRLTSGIQVSGPYKTPESLSWMGHYSQDVIVLQQYGLFLAGGNGY